MPTILQDLNEEITIELQILKTDKDKIKLILIIY